MVSGFKTGVPAAYKRFLRRFPGDALHEKGLKRQIGVGTLVSSQERRAAVFPRINRGSTARCVPQSA